MDLNWYNTLNKPEFTPPSGIFAPAWTILYLLIFLSLIVFLRTKTEKDKTNGIILYLCQLALNFLWSPIFFIWQNIETAFVVVILLAIFLIFNILEFYKISKLSAILLIPYLIWIVFVIYLNYGFMVLN